MRDQDDPRNLDSTRLWNPPICGHCSQSGSDVVNLDGASG